MGDFIRLTVAWHPKKILDLTPQLRLLDMRQFVLVPTFAPHDAFHYLCNCDESIVQLGAAELRESFLCRSDNIRDPRHLLCVLQRLDSRKKTEVQDVEIGALWWLGANLDHPPIRAACFLKRHRNSFPMWRGIIVLENRSSLVNTWPLGLYCWENVVDDLVEIAFASTFTVFIII